MAEFHSVLSASISTAHISIWQNTIMSYWLHLAEFKDGAHQTAALAPLKIGRFKRPLLRLVKVGKKTLLNPWEKGRPISKPY
jgi:hypothetical protein